LVFTDVTTAFELEQDPDTYGSIKKTLEAIKFLLVPKGQEVTLRHFEQEEHKQQILTFTTICDHGD
jgi:hypothetical protein